jgi:hypothetical protein
VNHHASSVFRLIWDPSAKGNYDTQLDKCQRPVVFNDHTVCACVIIIIIIIASPSYLI